MAQMHEPDISAALNDGEMIPIGEIAVFDMQREAPVDAVRTERYDLNETGCSSGVRSS
ncbi:hypothetical protein [Caballeronia grimmiae]|uniref:Uncharacterized protein n=1 Tax=Caballeronia grimmiae TaxID=1071679 RepID=A0ABQ1SAQ0_9BURK|nr:hypothetical protein [Caballeronia grimmiae]GGD98405.1 hypothetical protein GCM10010985_61470 [Caballeronia grimmiae]